MPNLAKLLREEITRIVRLEIRKPAAALQEESEARSKAIAELQRRIAALEKGRVRPPARRAPAPVMVAGISGETWARARFTGPMIRGLRHRLGITQSELGKLINVSAQSVYQWERKPDRLRFRTKTKAAFIKLRKMGLREIRQHLDEGTPVLVEKLGPPREENKAK